MQRFYLHDKLIALVLHLIRIGGLCSPSFLQLFELLAQGFVLLLRAHQFQLQLSHLRVAHIRVTETAAASQVVLQATHAGHIQDG